MYCENLECFIGYRGKNVSKSNNIQVFGRSDLFMNKRGSQVLQFSYIGEDLSILECLYLGILRPNNGILYEVLKTAPVKLAFIGKNKGTVKKSDL